MADLAQLENALRQADAAGDVESARVLAREIRKMIPAQSPTESKSLVNQIPGGIGEYKAPTQMPDATTIEQQIAANPVTRFATAAASPILAAGEMLPGGIGEFFRDKVSTLRGMEGAGEQNQSPLVKHMGTGANIAGNILSPASLGLMKALPYSMGATGLQRIPQLGKNMLSGAGGGALASLMTPVGEVDDFAATKMKNAGTSAAIGAVLPVGMEAGRGLLNLLGNLSGPFRAGWRSNAARQWLDDTLGAEAKQESREAIVNRGEIARGSPVTVADAIAQANMGQSAKFGSPLVKLEDVLDTITGGPSDVAKTIAAQQQAARAAEIGRIAKGPVEREAVRNRLNVEGFPAMQAELDAANAGLTPININKIVVDIGRKLRDPKIGVSDDTASVLSHVQKKLLTWKKHGQGTIDANAVYGIRKDAINEKIAELTAGRGYDAATSNRFAAKMLGEIRPMLDDSIVAAGGTHWVDALKKYADIARLGDEMDVGTILQKGLTGATGKERQASFAGALANTESKYGKESGRPLIESLSEKNRFAANRVQKEIERDVERQNLASDVRLEDVFDIAEKSKGAIKMPQLWNRPTSIARWLMHMTGNDADMKIARELHRLMKINPDAFAAKYLVDVPKSQWPKIQSRLEKAVIVGSAQSAQNGEKQGDTDE